LQKNEKIHFNKTKLVVGTEKGSQARSGRMGHQGRRPQPNWEIPEIIQGRDKHQLICPEHHRKKSLLP
jgi:hypothetical protein